MTQTTAIVPAINIPSVPTLGEIESLKEMCRVAAMSNFLSSTAPMSNQNQRAADAFFVVMYGREIGIPAMTALKTIYVIDGKPSCSGQAMLALLRRGGCEVDLPDPADVKDKATVRIRRPGGEWKSYSFTKEMAQQAGLLTREKTWGKYYQQMMIWRAVSMAARMEASDIVSGLYTVEEIAPDTAVDEDGVPVGPIIITRESEPAKPVPSADTQEGEYEEAAPQNWMQHDAIWDKFVTWLGDNKLTVEGALKLLGIQSFVDAFPSDTTEDGMKAAARKASEAVAAALLKARNKPAGWTDESLLDFEQWILDTYGIWPKEMLALIGKKDWRKDFPSMEAARKFVEQEALKRQMPVVVSKVQYVAFGKGKALDLFAPGIVLKLPGGRDALKQHLGADAEVFAHKNGLDAWEVGKSYDIDPLKVVWSKSDKGKVEITSISLRNLYPTGEDEVIDLASIFPREGVPG